MNINYIHHERRDASYTGRGETPIRRVRRIRNINYYKDENDDIFDKVLNIISQYKRNYMDFIRNYYFLYSRKATVHEGTLIFVLPSKVPRGKYFDGKNSQTSELFDQLDPERGCNENSKSDTYEYVNGFSEIMYTRDVNVLDIDVRGNNMAVITYKSVHKPGIKKLFVMNYVDTTGMTREEAELAIGGKKAYQVAFRYGMSQSTNYFPKVYSSYKEAAKVVAEYNRMDNESNDIEVPYYSYSVEEAIPFLEEVLEERIEEYDYDSDEYERSSSTFG